MLKLSKNTRTLIEIKRPTELSAESLHDLLSNAFDYAVARYTQEHGEEPLATAIIESDNDGATRVLLYPAAVCNETITTESGTATWRSLVYFETETFVEDMNAFIKNKWMKVKRNLGKSVSLIPHIIDTGDSYFELITSGALNTTRHYNGSENKILGVSLQHRYEAIEQARVWLLEKLRASAENGSPEIMPSAKMLDEISAHVVKYIDSTV